MRRLTAAATGLLLLGGCTSLGGNAEVAAEANGQVLRSEKVAELLNMVTGQRPNTEIGDFISQLWVDLNLLGQALAANAVNRDSAAIAEALWFDLSQGRITAWVDTVLSRRVGVTDAEVAAAYDGAEGRIFQHILIQGGATAADTAAAQRQVQQVVQGLRAGRTFASFAEELNPDATRQDGGYLPPAPRGAFVQPFDSVAWTLAPGQTSGVVQTQFGWHLIRRPPLDEAAPRMRESLLTTRRRQADSAFGAEISSTYEIEVAKSAPAAMRNAVADLEKGRTSNRTVATYKGGELTAGEFVHWISSLPPGFAQRVKVESDSALIGFAKLLTQNIVLLQQADSAGIPIPDVIWQSMQLAYQVSVDQIAAELGINASPFTDGSLSAAQRDSVVRTRVDDYILRLINGTAERRQILPGLAGQLRSTTEHLVNQAGITKAVELAMPKYIADSTAAAAGGVGAFPPGAVSPAPGPPPIPGGGQ